MTGEELDEGNEAPGTDTTGGAVTNKAPASVPPADAGHQADDADLDLLDADDGEEGADAAEPQPGEATDADRPAWQRPADLEGDALAEWKEAQGLPTDASGYEVTLDLEEGESITETGQQLIDGLKDFAVEHDLSPPAVSSLVKWYDTQIKAQQAKLAEADKALRTETRAALTQKWAGAYEHRLQVAKAGARLLPQGLREALKTARTQDGRRVADLPELAEAMLAIGRLNQKGKTVPTDDDARLQEIAKIRDNNIDDYRRQGLDREAMELLRKRVSVPVRTGTLTPAEAQEEAELVQQMQTDIDTYAHRPYRGTKKTAADRLLELRRKRDGVAA